MPHDLPWPLSAFAELGGVLVLAGLFALLFFAIAVDSWLRQRAEERYRELLEASMPQERKLARAHEVHRRNREQRLLCGVLCVLAALGLVGAYLAYSALSFLP